MGRVKAIELKGIVHNATKIGVQDGQSEDIVNLRFKDGAWRPTGDGKLVLKGLGSYTDLFIHTNVYRHLLGVSGGKLYWIATAEEDSPNDFETRSPYEITTVVGKVTVTQTGHLITVIDESDDFEFFVFKTNVEKYIQGRVDVNGKQSDRTLFPYGQIFFNLVQDITDCADLNDVDSDSIIYETEKIGLVDVEEPTMYGDSFVGVDPKSAVDLTRAAISHATDKNLFTRPFLVCAAIELYDGSYVYASNPVLVFPNEAVAMQSQYVNEDGDLVQFNYDKTDSRLAFGVWEKPNQLTANKYASIQVFSRTSSRVEDTKLFTANLLSHNIAHEGVVYPSFAAGANVSTSASGTTDWHTLVVGSKIHASISDTSIIDNNEGIFNAFCIFVSQEVEYIDWDSVKNGAVTNGANGLPMFYKNRDIEDITYDLMHSQMYLLKKYTKKTISELRNNGVVKLTSREDDGILKSIDLGTSSEYLTSESISRLSYVPKYAYSYNGKLHFANYETTQFHGYPIELFTKSNHSVKFVDGTEYPYLDIRNIEDDNDGILHWVRNKITLRSDTELVSGGAPSALAIATIETDNGIQKVCRYIKAESGIELEDMGAVLFFPDYRATKLEVYYVGKDSMPNFILKYRSFELKPHAYLNLAYYVEPNLRPIKWSSFTTYMEEQADGNVN